MSPSEVAQQILFRLAGTVGQWGPAAIGGLLAVIGLVALAAALLYMSTRAPR